MPVGDREAIFLTRGTVGELYDALTLIIAHENNRDSLVVTEVGLDRGQSTMVGAVAHSVRVEYRGRVVISADEHL